MAEDLGDADKTEEPTQKRLDEALKRGDVVKSQEVNTWFVIAGAALVLMTFSGAAGKDLTTTMRGLIANSFDISVDGPKALPRLFQKIGSEMIAAVAIPFLILLLAAVRRQHHPASPRMVVRGLGAQTFPSISPAAGGQDGLFSKQALANLGKGLDQAGSGRQCAHRPDVAGARGRLEALTRSDASVIMPLCLSLTLKLLGSVVAMLAVVAAADYLFQYRQWYERQKMSLRQLKEEFKQTEGDPAIKGRMKQVRQIRMRRRMMAAVPKATVVITNPTHYAIAL